MKYKLVLFDMDGTLLDGRTIYTLAEKKEFKNELTSILKSGKKFYEITIEIAKLLKGYKKSELIKIIREIPLQKDVEKLIKELKKRKIKTAIVTDSYQFVADDLRKRLDLDYAYANNLISLNGRFTGQIVIHNNELIKDYINNEIYSICKSCVLDELCDKLGISEKEVIAIGDGIVDISMLDKAGLGIAFKASEKVQKHADVTSSDIINLLNYL
ncbi:MAG: HAD family phosphatase [Candidatus Thermoplasmatota archaeon]|nr:HAD family phosphatase [Candidatus Thermoplasmatota archaeon]